MKQQARDPDKGLEEVTCPIDKSTKVMGNGCEHIYPSNTNNVIK